MPHRAIRKQLALSVEDMGTAPPERLGDGSSEVGGKILGISC